jgi:hypothetical protein
MKGIGSKGVTYFQKLENSEIFGWCEAGIVETRKEAKNVNF